MRREGSDDMSSNFQVMFLLKEQFIPKHLLQVPPGSENIKKKKFVQKLLWEVSVCASIVPLAHLHVAQCHYQCLIIDSTSLNPNQPSSVVINLIKHDPTLNNSYPSLSTWMSSEVVAKPPLQLLRGVMQCFTDGSDACFELVLY